MERTTVWLTILAALLATGAWSQQATRPAEKAPATLVESWSNIQNVAVVDPVYQMTAYTVGVPAGWKLEGGIVRANGCHSGPASLEYRLQSPDGQVVIERLRVVGWSWNYNPRFRYNMRCEPVDMTSAADFLVNIVVPNLHPTANILEVLPPTAEGAKALDNERERDQQKAIATAQLAGNPPGRAHVDGARIHILYEENGQQYEEMIMAAVHCSENPAGYACQSGGGETVVRTPAGYLSALMANPGFVRFAAAVQDNPNWQGRLAYDQQQTFLRILRQQNQNAAMLQAASNAAFRQRMQNSDILFQGMMANSRAFNAGQNAQFQQQQRNQIEIQQNMNWQAHQTVLYALDQKEYINPSNGQIVTASNRFNQVWGSSDGSLLVGTTGGVNPNSYTAPGAPVVTPLKPRD